MAMAEDLQENSAGRLLMRLPDNFRELELTREQCCKVLPKALRGTGARERCFGTLFRHPQLLLRTPAEPPQATR